MPTNPTWDDVTDAPTWDDVAGTEPDLPPRDFSNLNILTGTTPDVTNPLTGQISDYGGGLPEGMTAAYNKAERDKQTRKDFLERGGVATPEVTESDYLMSIPNALLKTAQESTGRAMQGLSALFDATPPDVPVEGMPLSDNQELNQQWHDQQDKLSPIQRRQQLERDPLWVAGQALSETAGEAHPVVDLPGAPQDYAEKAFNASKAAMGAAGGFFPAVAAGPGAPIIFGLQTAGQELTQGFDQLVATGHTPDEAADLSAKRALANGAFQGLLFELLPARLKAGGDAALNKLAYDGARNLTLTRLAAGRAAQGVEGAAFGAASQVGYNVVDERPWYEGLGQAAEGMGLIQALMPRGMTQHEVKTYNEKSVAMLMNERNIQFNKERNAVREKLLELGPVTEAERQELMALQYKKPESLTPDQKDRKQELEIITGQDETLSPEFMKVLEDATKVTDQKVEVINHPDESWLARWNSAKGATEINAAAMSRQLTMLPEGKRKGYLESTLGEEGIHEYTTVEDRTRFLKGSTARERKLAAQRYFGNSEGVSAVTGKGLTDHQLADEMIRMQVQRMMGMSPTEIAMSVGRSKEAAQAVVAIENLVRGARKLWNKAVYYEGGPINQQQAVLDAVFAKVQEARKQMGETRTDTPFSSVRESHITEDDLAKMSPQEKSKLKHNDGITYGLTLDKSDVPRLQEKYDAAQKRMSDVYAEGYDENPKKAAAHADAFADSIFYGGALMGATRGEHPISGSNYKLYEQQHQPASAVRGEVPNKLWDELSNLLNKKYHYFEGIRPSRENLKFFISEVPKGASQETVETHAAISKAIEREVKKDPAMYAAYQAIIKKMTGESGSSLNLDVSGHHPASSVRRPDYGKMPKSDNEFFDFIFHGVRFLESLSGQPKFESEANHLLDYIGARKAELQHATDILHDKIENGSATESEHDRFVMFENAVTKTEEAEEFIRKIIKQDGGQQSFAASGVRGGMSKKAREIAEQHRRIVEMQAKARGEELPEELKTKHAEAQFPPVAPEERVGLEAGGVFPPSAKDISEAANKVLSGDIKSSFHARTPEAIAKDVNKEEVSKGGVSTGSIKWDRPDFDKFVKSLDPKGWGKDMPVAQLRHAWEDAVWSHLLKADPARLEALRKSLGLERNYGSRPIVTEQAEGKFGLEGINDKVLARQQKLAAESKQRYREKIIGVMARKLIQESMAGRVELDRKSVGVDDVDFSNEKSKFGPYHDITKEDLADPKRLNAILRDEWRGSSVDPETASRRAVAVVDSRGKVSLLSTYNDAGVQRVVEPAGSLTGHKPFRELNKAFLNQYRPFASILLADPIKGLRQKFDTVGEFMDKIGEEAKSRSEIGELGHVPEGPAAADFEAEGTAGIEGEGGGFMGPEKQREVPSTSRNPALKQAGKLTIQEAGALLDQVMDKLESGTMESPDDVRVALRELIYKAKKKTLNARELTAVNAYRKIFKRLEKDNPDASIEELTDTMVQKIYNLANRTADHDAFAEKLVSEFGGRTAQPLATGNSRSPRELTMRGDIRPPTSQNVFQGPFQRAKAPGVELGAREPGAYIPESVGDQTPIQTESEAHVANTRDVTNDWAAAVRNKKAAAEAGIAKAKQIRDRALRKQGKLMTYAQAAKLAGYEGPMSSVRGNAEKWAKEAWEYAKSPAIMHPEAIIPDTDSPIPRMIDNVDSQLTRAMGIERIPLIGRLWGPRGKIRDAVDRAIIGYSVKRNIGNSQAALIGKRLNARIEELDHPFEQDADGKITNVDAEKGQSTYLADLFEDWQRQQIVPEKMKKMLGIDYAGNKKRIFSDAEIGRYALKHPDTFTLNKNQTALFREMLTYLEDAYQYLEEKNSKLDYYGGESLETRRDQVKLAGLPEGIEVRPFPRVALFKRTVGPMRTEISRRIGGSYGVERERLYKTEAQGQKTVAYEPDMVKRMVAFIQRTYKSVADADLANNPVLRGKKPEDRVADLSQEYREELLSHDMTQRDILDMANRARLGTEGEVHGHGAFANKIYPAEVAAKLNRSFGEQKHHIVNALAEASTMVKAFMLTGDLAQYAQQGAPMFFLHPKMWATATTKSLKSIMDPNVTGRYLLNPDNYKAATEFAQAGGSLGHLQDFMSGSQPGELATRLPGVRQVVTRSGQAFGTFFDVAKIEMWKALREMTPKEEWGKVVETIDNIVLSGKMESAGLSPGRATGERIALMASAYYRGALQLVAGMAESGVAGKESRKILGSYVMGAFGSMTALYLASGMSWDEIKKRLTPGLNNNKFLAYPIKTGNTTQEVGLGGIILNLASLGTDMAMNAKDPKAVADTAMKWLTQKLGPVPSTAEAIRTGKNAYGQDQSRLAAIGRNFSPIAVSRFIQGASGANKSAEAVSSTASFVGLNSKTSTPINDTYQMAAKFMKDSGLRKETGWQLAPVDEASYSKLRAAATAGSQSQFNTAYNDLLKTHRAGEIFEDMEKWFQRGFTGNERNEHKFRTSLNDYERGIYRDAIQQKRDIFRAFREMRHEVP